MPSFFHLEHPLFHLVLTTIYSFLLLLGFTKLLGKQQIAELTLYDYVAGITIGDIAAMIATDPPTAAFAHSIDMVIYTALAFLIAFISMKSRRARRFLEGTPTVVMANGRILEQNLRQSRYNVDNLKAKLRAKDVFDLADVQFAILENDGTVSVIRVDSAEKPTKQDLHVPTKAKQLPVDLVTEGRIHLNNLERMGQDQRWLLQQLAAYGIGNPRDVYYAGVDSQGRFYADALDNPEPEPKLYQ